MPELQPEAQEELTPRAAMLKAYDQHAGLTAEPEETPDGDTPPEESEQLPEETPDGATPPEESEQLPEEEPDGEPAPENAEDTPPDDGLSTEQRIRFQERARRRKRDAAHAEEVRKLKEQIAAKEAPAPEAFDVPEVIDDLDGTIGNSLKDIHFLKNEVATLRAQAKQREELDRQIELQKQNATVQRAIDELSEELDAEGFPGFEYFVDEVTRDINELGPEKAESLRNFEGFKEVYRTTTFPKVQRRMNAANNKTILDKRRELKEKGLGVVNTQVAGAQGGAPTDDNWSNEDYLKLRGLELET
jgi:hypothetical protein